MTALRFPSPTHKNSQSILPKMASPFYPKWTSLFNLPPPHGQSVLSQNGFCDTKFSTPASSFASQRSFLRNTNYYLLQVVLIRCCPNPQPFHVGLSVSMLPSTGTILSFTPGNVRLPALRSPLIRSITDSISSRTDTLLSLQNTNNFFPL